MKKIISLAKRRGFVFQSSEIYGGVEALWDYGPLGTAMKQNIRKAWFNMFVRQQSNIVAIEGAILMHPKVWQASGHIENFTDPLIECKSCNGRFRADHMIDGRFVGQGEAKEPNQCPNCGDRDFTPARNFNLMFKTFLGPIQDEANATYLRPETAQSMFTNFKLVQESQRLKVPFGIAQAGKAFRNEITTGNFIFRSREFEQMEIEYFVKPGEDEQSFDLWVEKWEQFFLSLGLRKENLRRYEHPKESLSHYSKRTVDIEYKFPFGWGELAGIANRTDFDLKQHAEFSGQDLRYFDETTKEKYFPYVIEPTAGLDRLFLALLCDAYEEVEGGRSTTTEAAKEKETMLKFSPSVAPVQVAVFPLVKNKQELVAEAKRIYAELQQKFSCQYDETGAIGRRYRRQDEIGTPFAVTVDFDTLEDDSVTLRNRDTMAQERVSVKHLSDKIDALLFRATME
ncbi:MAG: glycine--tRNA ligase [Candidatus Wildermuthbacteria bacterium RIFCSPHIGHO2_01_FULL_45_20]|uniref:Glycine--tRNA ligase n=1 Tax=Candidatus Wildermuthbacteria bacterium RIFCSPHIGHO2_02_FULL_45_25 TaxID=1802450 RepID=A0A1G2R3C8_9BACT|nr:MAG: glycine--tRNA ligase [Candidatus Wildermuthbacteria bacterium RIFCSPHIGHO2_01_FULL_45_20]OHA66591.1 MAG: glycine--tRNA ligase [Candidatus Wildermuthbacteria bacterium RIFCSPHIGHO2_02_FULL_45_25]